MSAIHIFFVGRSKHCDINMNKISSSVDYRTCPKNVRFPIVNNIFPCRVIARVLHVRLHLVLWRCEITNSKHKKRAIRAAGVTNHGLRLGYYLCYRGAINICCSFSASCRLVYRLVFRGNEECPNSEKE